MQAFSQHIIGREARNCAKAVLVQLLHILPSRGERSFVSKLKLQFIKDESDEKNEPREKAQGAGRAV